MSFVIAHMIKYIHTFLSIVSPRTKCITYMYSLHKTAHFRPMRILWLAQNVLWHTRSNIVRLRAYVLSDLLLLSRIAFWIHRFKIFFDNPIVEKSLFLFYSVTCRFFRLNSSLTPDNPWNDGCDCEWYWFWMSVCPWGIAQSSNHLFQRIV